MLRRSSFQPIVLYELVRSILKNGILKVYMRHRLPQMEQEGCKGLVPADASYGGGGGEYELCTGLL